MTLRYLDGSSLCIPKMTQNGDKGKGSCRAMVRSEEAMEAHLCPDNLTWHLGDRELTLSHRRPLGCPAAWTGHPRQTHRPESSTPRGWPPSCSDDTIVGPSGSSPGHPGPFWLWQTPYSD